ncbi:MAG: fucose isomerase, partial [Acidobacteria bacterium]
MNELMTMGIIVGNRGFFPDHLAKTGREEIIAALKEACINAVVLGPEESKYAAVETREESRKCADLFRVNQDKLDGIIVTLPNF